LKIKAVMFDLGNTLVRLCAPEVVFQRVLCSLGIDKSKEEIKKALNDTQRESKNHYSSIYGIVPCKEYWNDWDSRVLGYLRVFGHKNLSREIHLRWFDNAGCQCYSDVRRTLSNLRERGLRTGLISTGYEEDIYTILKKANIETEFFEVIIGADTIREVKPHPTVFRYALKRLNVRPQEALFIGDKIDEYEGAGKVGITSLLLVRTKNKTDKYKDIRVISTLREIFKQIV